jgi:hypothetical protein
MREADRAVDDVQARIRPVAERILSTRTRSSRAIVDRDRPPKYGQAG